MPRAKRRIEGGTLYHVLNRGNGRRMLFSKDGDFLSFIKVLSQGLERFEVDLLAFCLMGNHWHLLIRPRTDESLSRFMGWVTVTHARRHHMHHPSPGSGHLYQGRFKSFPVQSDEHFLTVARYIHANPVRAGLVRLAESWRWSDLHQHPGLRVGSWPIDRPHNWLRRVNDPQSSGDLHALQRSLKRGTPFGAEPWVTKTAARLNLTSTLKPRGRPKKKLGDLSPRYRKAVERKAEKSR